LDLVFKKLKRVDAYGFSKWGSHDDPRFLQYNFSFRQKAEYDAWYFSKQKLITRKVYGLFLEADPIGFITLKNIHWLARRAELGIAVDPNHMSEGYGTMLLERFLAYVFETFPIDTMQLKVSHFNVRAQKSYLKAGFVKVKEVVEPFEEQGYKDLILAKYPDDFDLVGGVLYTTFHVMQIQK